MANTFQRRPPTCSGRFKRLSDTARWSTWNEGMRMMRRVYGFMAAAMCFGLVSCMLVGCFWGEDEPASATTDTAAASSTTATSETDGTTSSEMTTTTVGPELIDGLPRDYVESLGERPIVVLFYVRGGVDDEEVLTSVEESEEIYSNYTFLAFDYRLPDKYGDLAQELAVDYPPHTVLIDRHGAIRTVWSGYVDKGTLNQTLLNLGRY